MFKLALLTAPATEPVTVDECKLDSRIDGTEFDSLLPDLIKAAREAGETATNTKLITQTWRVTANDWPAATDSFSLRPFQSATVSYWSGSAWVELAADQWALLSVGGGDALVPGFDAEWPQLGNLVGPRVRIDVVCGYGAAADVPAAVRMWIRSHVAAMLRSPDGMGDTSNQKMVPLHYLNGLADSAREWVI